MGGMRWYRYPDNFLQSANLGLTALGVGIIVVAVHV